MNQGAAEAEGTSSASAPTFVGVRVARTSLVGREREIAAAAALLRRDDVRLLVLVGPGGVGKTRLAVKVAENLTAAFAGGVTGVDLSPVRDPAFLPRAIAVALGLRDRGQGGEEPLHDLLRALAGRPRLLLLDNLEHLMPAAPLIGEMLAAAPLLTILVTSRERVPLAAAHHLQTLPLALPDETAAAGDLESSPAVRLFVARARTIDDRFEATTDTIAAIGHVCRRLDGLPLAIELAAARVNLLSPRAMLDRLDSALPFLDMGPVDADARHHTMRAAIAWGYDLLALPLQRLFRRLAVFRGGFTLDGVAAVANDSAPHSALDLLAALIDRSLVHRVDDGGEVRYAMLETLREFGRDALAMHPAEERQTLRRHAAWVTALVVSRARESFALIDEDAAFAQLDAESANIAAALDHATTTGDAATALHLVGSLWLYWTTRGALQDEERWIDRLLAMPALATIDPVTRADGLCGAAWVKALRGAEAAERIADEALAAARAAGDTGLEARALVMRSLAQDVHGADEASLASAAEAVDVARGAAERDWLPFALNRHGLGLLASGHPADAAARFEEALARWRANGFGWGIGTALENLAGVTRQLGHWERAVALYHEQLWLPGDPRDVWGTAISLVGLAEIALGAGDPTRGARLLGAAGRMLAESGIALAGLEAEHWAHARAAARTILGVARFATEEEAGRELGYDEVMETALAVTAPRTGAPPVTPGGLSPREIEVLRLLAAGASDREIADRLFLSPRTVESHVAAVRRKLGVANRAEAAVAAVRLGLTSNTPDQGINRAD